jgi:hypothetical protein
MQPARTHSSAPVIAYTLASCGRSGKITSYNLLPARSSPANAAFDFLGLWHGDRQISEFSGFGYAVFRHRLVVVHVCADGKIPHLNFARAATAAIAGAAWGHSGSGEDKITATLGGAAFHLSRLRFADGQIFGQGLLVVRFMVVSFIHGFNLLM